MVPSPSPTRWFPWGQLIRLRIILSHLLPIRETRDKEPERQDGLESRDASSVSQRTGPPTYCSAYDSPSPFTHMIVCLSQFPHPLPCLAILTVGFTGLVSNAFTLVMDRRLRRKQTVTVSADATALRVHSTTKVGEAAVAARPPDSPRSQRYFRLPELPPSDFPQYLQLHSCLGSSTYQKGNYLRHTCRLPQQK